MKINEKYYTEFISEELESCYDEKKHGSIENFMKIIAKSVKSTVKFYKENFNDDFDTEIFESDLINDAKKMINNC